MWYPLDIGSVFSGALEEAKGMRARAALVFGLALLGSATTLLAQQAAPNLPANVDFRKDVQPILTLNCIACHQGSSATQGLQLDSYENLMNGSDSGKVIIPGDPKQSLLVQRISDTTGKQMPPQTSMSPDDIAVIVAWVQQGAKPSAAGISSSAAAPTPVAIPVTASSSPREIVNQYCIGCHNQRLKTAGLELDQLDLSKTAENAATLEKLVHMVGTGMMPPATAAHPSWDVREALVTKLENQLDKSAVIAYTPPGLHRLNRVEYANAIRDLLGVEVDPTKFLPPDDSTHGFDNQAGTLTLSPSLLEGYMSAAGKVSRLALGEVSDATEAVYIVPADESQDYHVEGLPFGTRGGMLVKHDFPTDGEYEIKIASVKRGNMGATRPFGDMDGEKLEVLLDGQRVQLLDWDKETVPPPGSFEPRALDVHIAVKAGPHTIGATFLATNYAPIDDHNKHFMRTTIETGGIPGFSYFPHLASMRVDGPYNPQGAHATPSLNKIFVCRPASPDKEDACAKQIVSALARHAYRRPATAEDVDTLMSFYKEGRKEGGDFDHGIQLAVERVLADPQFLFRKEYVPENVAVGKAYRISDLELASRLSFFLWSSIPDDELINLASQGKLRNPEVLEAQVRRMLADPRSDALTDNFTGQWLNLRGLQSAEPVAMLYPDFDDNLRQSFLEETQLFFGSIVHEDRSIMDLLTANYTFLNERLAKHYGIPNIYGSEFRRVELGPEFDMRRGLLGKGALMAISSATPDRTSPTKRGKWFLQTFLDITPPDPPPNIPPLKAQTLSGGNLNRLPTMKEQMAEHRANEPCASCHKIMDPIGLSLENFDDIGAWRTRDAGQDIDASGMLVDGTKLNGVADLRAALSRYSNQFAETFTKNLMTYALGRGVEYNDMPVVRSIDEEASHNNYRFSSIVLGIVKNPLFQMNTKVQPEPKAGQQVAER
jgi:mono/diheme cytochrome c family protein